MNDELQRFIDELRARVSIADVVGAKVKLTKKGREYQGLCPFHNEKTPSFTVNEAKGFYHCFGCGAHGDIIKFEMEANGLPFIDALQKLAHQAGLQMPKLTAQDKEKADERKSLYDIMESACCFFEKELLMPTGAEGLKYFTEKRGLSKETIKKFRLGFAPQNNALMTHLKAQGVEEKDLKELGLMTVPEDKSRRPHDFFRNRVMIPITNKQGKIIAFGGRVMEKIEPKYLNSPETPIFNKRRNLYNLDKARESAYQEKNLIICEGYMDVIALDRYGFNYAVAPLGTALTEEQITEAWRICPEPIVCLDGDAPGTKAAMRAVDRVLPLLKAGYSLKFLFLPDNQDPDEYLQAHGHDSFAALMKTTKPLIDILWQKYTEGQDSSTPEKKALIEKTIWEAVNKIPDTTVRGYYTQEIKNRLYLNFKLAPWHKEKQQPQAAAPRQEAYTSSAPQEQHSAPRQAAQPPRNNYFNQTSPRFQSSKRPNRPLLQHNIVSTPQDLRHKAETEEDKNLRFILASLFIYPELIDEYEERLFVTETADENLKTLLSTMMESYHDAETPLSAEELQQQLSQNATVKSLWEIDMLKRQSPFINDLRHNIDKLLLEDRLHRLEQDIKSLTEELCKNFNEEVYHRLSAFKKERDEILCTAATPDDN